MGSGVTPATLAWPLHRAPALPEQRALGRPWPRGGLGLRFPASGVSGLSRRCSEHRSHPASAVSLHPPVLTTIVRAAAGNGEAAPILGDRDATGSRPDLLCSLKHLSAAPKAATCGISNFPWALRAPGIPQSGTELGVPSLRLLGRGGSLGGSFLPSQPQWLRCPWACGPL